MKKLEIILDFFKLAFDRDIDYHDKYPQHAYLDRDSGEIIWVYSNDKYAQFDGGSSPKENRNVRTQIMNNQDQYIEILGRTHGQHHDILREFLDSEWTNNLGYKKHVQECYFGSIGGWMEKINDQETIWAYEKFRHEKLKKMAEEYLNTKGIDPVWK